MFKTSVPAVHSFFRKGKDTLRNVSLEAFHEIQFQEHFIKYEMLS